MSDTLNHKLIYPPLPPNRQQAYIYPQKPFQNNDESHCVVHPMGSRPACGSGASKMSCIVLPSLKLRMVVASVARLFEEVICLRSVSLVLPQILASCLCFRLNTQRVWRVVVECVLRLVISPDCGIDSDREGRWCWRFGCSALHIVEWRSGEGGSLPVSRREFSFDFFRYQHYFFLV